MGTKNRTFHDLLEQNNEISAYLLGFWMADGSISLSWSKGRVKKQKRFNLGNTDHQLMMKFGELFGKEPRLELRPKGKNYYTLTMKSDQLFDFCYAITHSTSKSDKEISIPSMDPKLFHHFVRGFFDGDGSIHIKHCRTRHGKISPSLQTSFTAGKSTGDFLLHLRDKIREFVPVAKKKISDNSTNTSKKLVFNQYDSMMLCEWMYEDATWFMERKRAIWDSIDKEKLKRSTKYFNRAVNRNRTYITRVQTVSLT